MPLVELPIGQLFESKTNPRKHFDPAKLAELAASAKEHGIIEPLVVRPKGANHEIVCGARRYRAAKLAELTVLPVRVMELTDEQVLETQIIENLQREDPHPMEEADGYARLIAMGHTADELALKVGKDRSYIYKRIQLAALIKPAKEAFLEGRINIGHAILICRLPDPKQKLAFDACYEEKWTGNKRVADTKGNADTTAKELALWIRENLLLDLSAAPWKKDDAQLVPKAGPCTTCPKRTGANQALFDDFKKGDQCLDGECYGSKREAFLKIQIKAHPELPRITLDHRYNVRGKLPTGVMCQNDGYELVKPNAKCASAEPAIVAAGHQQVGLTILICRLKTCKTHAAKYGVAGSGGNKKTPAQLWKDRQAKLESRITLEINHAVWREIVDSVPEEFNRPEMEFVARKLIYRAGHDGRRALCAVLALEGAKREYGGADFQAPLLAHMKSMADKDLPGWLIGLSLYGALAYPNALDDIDHDEFDDEETDIVQMAALYDVDIKAADKAIRGPALAKFETAKAKALAKKAEPKKKAAAK